MICAANAPDARKDQLQRLPRLYLPVVSTLSRSIYVTLTGAFHTLSSTPDVVPACQPNLIISWSFSACCATWNARSAVPPIAYIAAQLSGQTSTKSHEGRQLPLLTNFPVGSIQPSTNRLPQKKPGVRAEDHKERSRCINEQHYC